MRLVRLISYIVGYIIIYNDLCCLFFMMDYMVDFVEAKYHLVVARRMMKSYREYPEKRFLVGVINEEARVASRIIRAFLIYEGVRGGMKKFLSFAGKYLDDSTIENLGRILEVERAQKVSPVEFSKDNKVILLIDGKYRILTVERLNEFLKSLEKAVLEFPGNFRQV